MYNRLTAWHHRNRLRPRWLIASSTLDSLVQCQWAHRPSIISSHSPQWSHRPSTVSSHSPQRPHRLSTVSSHSPQWPHRLSTVSSYSPQWPHRPSTVSSHSPQWSHRPSIVSSHSPQWSHRLSIVSSHSPQWSHRPSTVSSGRYSFSQWGTIKDDRRTVTVDETINGGCPAVVINGAGSSQAHNRIAVFFAVVGGPQVNKALNCAVKPDIARLIDCNYVNIAIGTI